MQRGQSVGLIAFLIAGCRMSYLIAAAYRWPGNRRVSDQASPGADP